MSTIPVALQLYTVRDLTEEDFVGALRTVSEIGYAGVEFAGYGGLSALDMHALLHELHLAPTGAHVGLDQLETNISGVIDYHLTIGSRFVACPWMPEGRRQDADGWKRTAELLNGIGETCARQGITLCYHNHDFEFTRFDGQTGMDILYSNTDPRYLQAELDLYWVKKAGEDPAAYMQKFAGRLPLLHLKDMAEDGAFAEVGTGILPWDAIFAAAPEIGVQWYIVEQDVCRRPCQESIAISFHNLQARGLA
jgi:sugar phosphate isomerase/epimerase